MLEIVSDIKKTKRDAYIGLLSIIPLFLLIYGSFRLIGVDMMMAYIIIFITYLIAIPVSLLGFVPIRIVFDEEKGELKYYFGKRVTNSLSLSKISNVKLSKTGKNELTLLITQKRGMGLVIRTWQFKKEDIELLFNSLLDYSDKYGYNIETDTSAIIATSHINEKIGGNEPPYRVV